MLLGVSLDWLIQDLEEIDVNQLFNTRLQEEPSQTKKQGWQVPRKANFKKLQKGSKNTDLTV